MKRLILSLTILLLVTACSANNTNNKDQEILFTTIYPLEFILDELIGEEIKIQTVYPPGVDAHSYEPTTREMLQIANGVAFFYLGLGMEGFAEKAKTSLKNSEVSFIEIGKHQELFSQFDAGHQTHYDPHLWFDPLRMIKMADIIKGELTILYPEKQETIEKNYLALAEELEKLDKYFLEKRSLTNKRHILVSHGAYQYWEERYDIVQIPISGLTATEEPSQKELANLMKQVEELQIDYVLFEKHSTNQTAEIIRQAIGAERAELHNLEVLFEADLESEKDYFSLMRENIEVIEKALK